MISVVGQASAVGTSVALPAHQPGDVILIFARRASNTAPSIPAAGGTVPSFTAAQSGGANTLSLVSATAIATASNHTSGTWTNASHICALVLRTDSSGGFTVGPSSTGNGSAVTTLVYPALTLGKTDGTSMGVRCGTDSVASTPVGTAPTNWTAQSVQPAGASALMSVHTRASLSANPTADTVTGLTSGAYRAHTIEVQENPPPPAFPVGGIADDFNRANQMPPGASWAGTKVDGWQVISNRAVNNLGAASWDGMYWNITPATDQECYVTIAQAGADTRHLQLMVRRDPVADTCYLLDIMASAAGNDSLTIYRRVASADTQLGAIDTSQNIVAGDSVGFSIKGNSIYVWRKPSGGSWTLVTSRVDSTITAAGVVQIFSNDPSWIIDDFGGPAPAATPIAGSDTGSGSSETTAITQTTPVSGADTGTGADSITDLDKVAADTGAGAEASVLTFQAATTDTGSGADSSSLIKAGFDTGAGSETGVAAVAPVSVSGSDTGAGAESVGRAIASADTGSGSETSALTFATAVTDTGAGSEVSAETVVIASSDVGAGIDASSAAPPLPALVPTSELGTPNSVLGNIVLGLPGPLGGTFVNGSDTGTSVESLLASAAISANEASSGSESLLTAGTLGGADSSTGSELSSPVAAYAVADVGAGLESALARYLAASAETGTGVESGQFTAVIPASDTGVGAEVLALIALSVSADAGVGSDTILALVKASADLSSGAETGQLAGLIPGSDIGASAEISSLSLVIAAAEVAVGNESLLYYAAMVAAETGATLDQVLTWLASGFEAGIGADTASLSLATFKADADYGTSVDALLQLALSSRDTGAGADASVLAGKPVDGDASSGVEGSALVAQIAQIARMQLVTTGNEITDALRSLGIQGDGKIGDYSFGIWEQTTNRWGAGGFESVAGFTARPTSTVTRSQEQVKFGSWALKVVMQGAVGNEGTSAISTYRSASAPGDIWTNSAWIYDPIGGSPLQIGVEFFDSGGTYISGSYQSFTSVQGWQRVVKTATAAPANTAGAAPLGIRSTSAFACTVYLDGVQMEKLPYATPYVDTNGVFVTRGNGYVTIPTNSLNDQQGWIAVRMRSQEDAAGRLAGNTYQHLFSWYALGDTTTFYDFYYNGQVSPGQFTVRRNIAGVNTALKGFPLALPIGTMVTAIFQWDATTVSVSINGGAFQKSGVGTGTISLASNPVAFIGGIPYSTVQSINSDVLWVAGGKGTLTDADAVTLNAIGDTDPNPDLTFKSESFVWPASDTSYSILAAGPPNESGAGADASLLAALFAAADAGSGSDISSLVARLIDSDTGTGVDVLSQIVRMFVGSDSATGAEGLGLLAALSASDSSTSTDASVLVARLVDNDLGSSLDSGGLALFSSGADSGSGNDLLSALARAAADAGLGSEQTSQLILGALESGSSLESALPMTAVTSTDFATGQDLVIYLVAVVSSSDSGSSPTQNAVLTLYGSQFGAGSETISLLAVLDAFEIAEGQDSLNILHAISDIDEGIAEDIARIARGIILPSVRTGRVDRAEEGKVEVRHSGVVTRPKPGVGRAKTGRAGYVARPKAGVAE